MFSLENGIQVDFNIEGYVIPPNTPGVYFVCGKDISTIKELIDAEHIPLFNGYPVIYIGISEEGLYNRDYKTHFNGTARRSTLRKSLGALMSWKEFREYEIGSSKYAFDNAHEKKLSAWMHSNLFFYYWYNLEENLRLLEKELINKYSPPLNIQLAPKDINSDFRKNLKKLRN